MINKVYIISWFGKSNMREDRKNAHQKQIDWFLEHFSNLNIYILPQLYESDDFINHPKIHYLENQQKLLNPSQGRNILLREFYSSNDDFALFADNDCIVEDSFSGLTFIDEMSQVPELYDDIALTSAADIEHRLVQIDHRKNMRKREGYHWFIPAIRMHTAFTIRKNIKDNPIYYDPDLSVGEDTDFNFKLILAGYKPYIFGNLIFKELSKQSTIESDYEKKKEIWKACEERELDRYKLDGLYGTRSGKPNYDAFLNTYGVDEKIIEIGKIPKVNKFF